MDDFIVVTVGDGLDSALTEASALLRCALDEVGWVEVAPERASVCIAAVGLCRSPEGPGRIVDDHPQAWPRGAAQQILPLEKPLKIEGDVTAFSGEVRHYGDVIVLGSTRQGASVSAGGALWIRGDIEGGAQASAYGNVTVKGGILGDAVSLSGDLTCGYAYGARLTAGFVRVLNDATQCLIEARDQITCGGVIGGRLYADNAIIAVSLGSDLPNPAGALLQVGRRRRIEEKLRIVGERLASVEDGIAKVRRGERAGGWSEARLKNLACLTNIYRASIVRLEPLLTVDNPDANISISTCFPGSRVIVDGAALDTARFPDHVSFVRYSKEPQSGMLITVSDE